MTQSSKFSLKAALYALSAALSFAFMAAAVRGLSPGNSGLVAVFVRCLIGSLVALSLHKLLKTPFKIVNKKAMLLRVTAGSIALITFFESLRRIDLATATLLLYTCPLWVSILARIFLKEHLKWTNWLGLPLGILGILLILAPSLTSLQNLDNEKSLGIILGIICSFSSAIAYTTLRVLGRTDDPLTTVTAFSVTGLLVSAPFAIPNLTGIPQHWDLVMLITAGICGASGQLFLTSAYKHGQAAQVAVTTLAQVPLAVILSFLFFNVSPAPTFLIGGLLVFLGAALQVSNKKSAPITNLAD
jgi:drug/metabolite transporter (DMT)-like permease